MYSNPALKDTDYDGLEDGEEEQAYRMDNTFTGTMLGTSTDTASYSISDAEYTMDFRAFFASNTVYNSDLASASLQLSNAIYDGCGFSYDTGNTIKSAVSMLVYHGFEEVLDYSLENYYDDDNVSEVAIGYQTVEYNGETRTIVAVVVRGTNGTVEEWSSNFDIGDPLLLSYNYHSGFYETEQRIKEFLEEYAALYLDDATDVVYWVTGHSRGAAIANILAAELVDEGETVYAYTFATPTVVLGDDCNASQYSCIFNFVNLNDLVTYLPLTSWGFDRYGVTLKFALGSSAEAEWCTQTGNESYDPYSQSLLKNIVTEIYSWAASRELYYEINWDDAQTISWAQYDSLSSRALALCYTTPLIDGVSYLLYPSAAYVFQIFAEAAANETNISALLELLSRSDYVTGLSLILLGKDAGVIDPFDLAKLLANASDNVNTWIGDAHAPATYYVILDRYG